MKRVRESQALVKTLEALDALQTRYRYDCNARPVPLPTGEGAASATNKQLLPFFGISAGWAAANGTNTHALLAALSLQWVAHCDAWTAPPAGKAFSPRCVNDYWVGLRGSSKELSTIAEIKWAAIPSNGACERVFSYLSRMDDPRRRTMQLLLLENALMLRFNRSIVVELAKQLRDDIDNASGSLKPASESQHVRESKVKRAAAAAAATSKAAAAAGMATLQATAGVGKKRGRAAADSDEDDEVASARASPAMVALLSSLAAHASGPGATLPRLMWSPLRRIRCSWMTV